MIQHVYERAARAELLDRVVVACDDRRIYDAVRAFGGEAAMTRTDHRTGTDRIAEAAQGMDAEVVVNVQGDEPLLDPRDIDLATRALMDDPTCLMATLCTSITASEDLDDPACVKVVLDLNGFALYFSRALVPYCRNVQAIAEQPVYRHIGLYAYRRSFLFTYASLPPTPLQIAEGLEQLKVLEHGYKIRCVETDRDSIGVDTERDLERVRALFRAGAVH